MSPNVRAVPWMVDGGYQAAFTRRVGGRCTDERAARLAALPACDGRPPLRRAVAGDERRLHAGCASSASALCVCKSARAASWLRCSQPRTRWPPDSGPAPKSPARSRPLAFRIAPSYQACWPRSPLARRSCAPSTNSLRTRAASQSAVQVARRGVGAVAPARTACAPRSPRQEICLPPAKHAMIASYDVVASPNSPRV